MLGMGMEGWIEERMKVRGMEEEKGKGPGRR
jgi:hypothetical protein